jgi:TrmH family RNA methyltransferase
MGAHFNLSIYTRTNLKELSKLGHEIVAADQNGEPLKSLKKISDSFCLVMGSEAHGVSEKSRALADKIISIPGNSGADSLNVAVAAGILLFTLFDKP